MSVPAPMAGPRLGRSRGPALRRIRLVSASGGGPWPGTTGPRWRRARAVTCQQLTTLWTGDQLPFGSWLWAGSVENTRAPLGPYMRATVPVD